MNKNITRVLAVTLLTSSSLVSAETSRTYMGIDYVDSLSGETTQMTAYSLRLGYDLNNILAIEGLALASAGVDNGTSSEDITGYGAFLRFNLRYEKVTLYALAGYTSGKQTGGTDPAGVTNSDFGYGMGIDIYATRDTAFTFTSMMYQELTTNVEISGNSVGFTYYFDAPRVSSRY